MSMKTLKGIDYRDIFCDTKNNKNSFFYNLIAILLTIYQIARFFN